MGGCYGKKVGVLIRRMCYFCPMKVYIIYDEGLNIFEVHRDLVCVSNSIGISSSGLRKALKRNSVYRRGRKLVGISEVSKSNRGGGIGNAKNFLGR